MDDSGRNLIFRLLWPHKAKGRKKHVFVERLQELNDARSELLADDEYAQMRKETLSELTKHYKMPFVRHITFTFCCGGCIALIVFDHTATHSYRVGGIVGLAAGLLMWIRMAQSASATGALSRDDRLGAVDDLLTAKLISEDEASKLRARIDKLFHDDRAA